MTKEQFIYWLQGYSEIQESRPSEEQWEMIKEHLSTVFIKKTSSMEEIKKVLEDNKTWTSPPFNPTNPLTLTC